jgi:hypothetical protein
MALITTASAESARSAQSTQTKANRLLIISTGAGSITLEVEAKPRAEFADHLIIPFNPSRISKS